MRIGLISDTHGLMRPEAARALEGSDLIVHAGDVGDPAVLTALERIAPVHAVAGNNDRTPWAKHLPQTRVVEAGAHLLYVLHDLSELDLDPEAAGFHAVICGHSHVPRVERRGTVLYVNPGSAGPRRFRLPVSVGTMQCGDAMLEATIVEIVV